MTIEAKEVLVLDSSTFIKEIGMMSPKGSALKHYLYRRGTQLIVPQAAAEEYERNLVRTVKGKIGQVQKELRWLAQFFSGGSDWQAPGKDEIENRARVVAAGESLEAIVLPETGNILERARRRHMAERPPSHKTDSMGDCRIWEQCLELLSDHEVVFVSADHDFRGRRDSSSLHPQLQDEAVKAGAGRTLTFYPDMESLLCELKSEISPIPDCEIFYFIYEAEKETVQELQSNSGCQPTSTGAILQTRLTTEARDIIEVRLEVRDRWVGQHGASSLRFEMSGSCRYNLGSKRLTDLRTDEIRLLITEPDGSERAVTGSYASLRPHALFIGGLPPIDPERGTLE